MTTFKKPSKPSEVKQGTPINTTDINVVGRTHEPVEKYSQDIQVGDIVKTSVGYQSILEVHRVDIIPSGESIIYKTKSITNDIEVGEKVWVFVPYIKKPTWYKEPSEHHYWTKGNN